MKNLEQRRNRAIAKSPHAHHGMRAPHIDKTAPSVPTTTTAMAMACLVLTVMATCRY